MVAEEEDGVDGPARNRNASLRNKDALPDKIKRTQLLTICVAQLNEAIQITMPYTVAVYMVRDFLSRGAGGAADEEVVGRLTGILAACFCAAQFVSSFPWGRISDKFGRKPMLVMSNLSSCLSVVGFGLSQNFGTAAAFRLAGGMFNCTFVCLKSMIGESCNSEAQARPLSYLSLCWGLGTVIGPSLGGVLSQPCETWGNQFPLCGQNQLLQIRPFFLPCFVVGVVSFVALLSSVLFMDETLPSKVAAKYSALPISEEDIQGRSKKLVGQLPEMELARLAEGDPLQPHGVRDKWDDACSLELHFPEEGFRAQRADVASPFNEGPDANGQRGWDKRIGEGQEHGFLRRNDTASQMSNGLALPRLKLASDLEEGLSDDEKKSLISKSVEPSHDATPSASSTPHEGFSSAAAQQVAADQLAKAAAEGELGVKWYRNKEVLLSVSSYTMICLLYNLMDEVTPIFGSAAREDGGLGLTTSEIALPLALGGVSIFLWSMFCYPRFQQLLGVLNTCRFGLVCSIPLCLGVALPSFLAVDTLALQLMLAAVLCCKNIMATNSFTASVIMVNAKAPQNSMGAVNGASQAAASFVRAVGPALGGLMWGFSVATPIQGHQLLPFVVNAAGFVLPLLILSAVKMPGAKIASKQEEGAEQC